MMQKFKCHCFRGDEFRKAFALIGELRCLIPHHVRMLALTATATQTTFDAVVERLSLEDPVTIALPPCRANIKLIVRPATKLEEFALEPAVREAKNLKIKLPKNHPVLSQLPRLLKILYVHKSLLKEGQDRSTRLT